MKRALACALGCLLAGCNPQPPPPGQRFPDPLDGLFATLDRDRSGTLSQSELRAADPADLLPRLDLDGDGLVSKEELMANLALWPEDLAEPAVHGPRSDPAADDLDRPPGPSPLPPGKKAPR